MGLEVFGISGARTAPGTGRRVRLAPPGDPAVTSWWWREPGDTSAPLRSGSTGLLASLTLSQTGGARSPGGELRLRKACFILRDSERSAGRASRVCPRPTLQGPREHLVGPTRCVILKLERQIFGGLEGFLPTEVEVRIPLEPRLVPEGPPRDPE